MSRKQISLLLILLLGVFNLLNPHKHVHTESANDESEPYHSHLFEEHMHDYHSECRNLNFDSDDDDCYIRDCDSFIEYVTSADKIKIKTNNSKFEYTAVKYVFDKIKFFKRHIPPEIVFGYIKPEIIFNSSDISPPRI